MSDQSDKPDSPWNEKAGETWVRLEARTDLQLDPFGLALLERVSPVLGEHVLDVGCGAGQTLVQLAERVGTEGRVVGLDISEPLLARARQRVDAAGLRQVELVNADAATHAFERPFDLAFSRFGVMFFHDSVAAFRHLRHSLRAGGRLGFVSWQPLEQNPWATVPLAAARRIVPQQPLPPLLAPGGSGPFSLSEPPFIQRTLEEAGFTSIHIEAYELAVLLGGPGSLDDAVAFVLELGPTARFVAESPPSLLPALRAAVREALAPFAESDGVRMPFRTFLVTAQR